MFRYRIFLFVFVALLLVADGWGQEYQCGVSRELAEQRASSISDLTYDLTFRIPDSSSVPVEGSVVVAFSIADKGAVALDFACGEQNIRSVSVAGKKKKAEWLYTNEHVVIPEKYVHKGRNAFQIDFVAGSQSLNRSEEYMYTLFVPDRARTCFPCFDQPDMKARFTLHLQIPKEWKAVTNSPLVKTDAGMLTFAQSEPLPTYLFAFAAGKFEYSEYAEDGMKIGAYYRETDHNRTAQLPEIARQIMFSLRWQEEFTGHPYGFSKYDFVVLPGFQFGGMEHTGCTFYNDTRLFLSENPTPDEILERASLIAHETSHMWFGDLVTMRWFDDVWTKEVFANYFAAEITHPQFPDVNYSLYWLHKYKMAAISEDRTEGRTAIQQPLDNMRNAGLIYNNIIYNKAPLVMRDIVDLMGHEAFRRGIRRYVSEYAYGNATWDDLIAILSAEAPCAGLEDLSTRWIKNPNYPTLQSATFRPDADGRRYGYYELTAEQIDSLLAHWPAEKDAVARQSFLMTLNENYLHNRIADRRWVDFLTASLATETDPLTLSTLVSYLGEPIWRLSEAERADAEARLLALANAHPVASCRLQLVRLLYRNGTADETNKQMYVLWRYADNELLSVNDYMTMAYELALRYPTMARDIIEEERGRIINPDREREFAYVSQAVSPSAEVRDSVFLSLLVPENRRVEPWASAALYYLNHPLRDSESARLIRPALEALEDVQRTGDIFFPSQWCRALLSGHRSKEARTELDAFLQSHPGYPPLLLNKILVNAYNMRR